MRRRRTVALLLGVAALGCGGERSLFEKVSLMPGPNPFGPDDPLWSQQPARDHPFALVLSRDGGKLYVALQGVEDEPGHEVAVVSTATETVTRRIPVGSSPTGIALHPGGRFVVVTNRFSNFASVIDAERDEVVADIQVPFYCIDMVFAPDGKRAFLSNRWKDSVLTWELSVGAEFKVLSDNYSQERPEDPMGIPVGDNPRDLTLSEDGARLYVGSPTALGYSIIDTASLVEVERVFLSSPPGDVLALDDKIVVTHTGRGTQHPPDLGWDTDSDGFAGDGTANVMFQDLQNEIAVFAPTGEPLSNYTSDTICCGDYRDVDPDHPLQGESLRGADVWPASRVDYLPPRDTWTVACALPEQMARFADRLYVVCSGSNEVQPFAIAADGSLDALAQAGELFRTGMNPAGIAIAPDGAKAYVAERLGEYVTVLDLEAGPGAEHRILVGDVSGGEFPATDAEIGEAINFVTAGFTVDGDQTCVHCHREGGNLAKPVAMPLQEDVVWGTRMPMAYRGAFDTRPWFFETAMDETNFFPVINEFARKENFCCEQLDTLIWSRYPSLTACQAEPGLAGCQHVLNCTSDPPPECAARSYGSPYLTRNAHFRQAALALLGRDRTLGDALFQEVVDENGNTVREGIPLDFTGTTRALGLFLLTRPRFLPNPNAYVDLPAARRGRLIYESLGAGCATCHPLPVTTVTAAFNPFAVPLRFPALVTPRLHPNTQANVDVITPGFLGTFPDAEQGAAGIYFGVPQLRGVWDRAPRFLHDGRAPSLVEALATPYHPALSASQAGCNELYGMPNTHGSTGQLSAEELSDLVAFLLTL